jgi:intergrase/recombinase
MARIIKFACLIGLRPSEMVESVKLINRLVVSDEPTRRYYNPERQALEHFRFPDIFLRQTKKAYISFVTPEMLSIVEILHDIPSQNAITHACQRRHIKMDMHLTRKIFASHLRQEGIQPEIVDLLQGRVSQSVLTRHYLVPQRTLSAEVLDALKQLQKQL